MAKKQDQPKHSHNECFFSTPYLEGHLNTQGEPILGTCKYHHCKFLLSETNVCQNFKKK